MLKLKTFCAALFASSTLLTMGVAQAQPAEKVTYLLPAPPNLPAFGPWMIAQQKGYYAQENLDVNFVAGRGGVDVAKQIGAGNAVIGGAIGDTSIIVRANGIPVKSVAVLGQGSLTLFATQKGSGIKSLKDLSGKSVSVISYADTTYYALLGNLRDVGLTKNDVSIQAAGPAGVWQLFASKKFDAMAGVPDWVVSAEDTGASIELIPHSGGFQSMAQAIVTSDEMIKKNPQLIQKLVRATLRGMQDIMNDPKAAAKVYVQAVPSYQGKEAVVERIFNMYRQHVYANQKVPGHIDAKRLAAVQEFYVKEGIVPQASPVDSLYTNQFVGGE